MLVDTTMKKVVWIALAVIIVVVLVYGVFRILEVIGSTKNNEVTTEG
jgi:hypothetical protein